jgi:hypothetical protein
MDCIVCGTLDAQKPMIFRNTGHCSDSHRKVINGEISPTDYELTAMERLAAAGNEDTQSLLTQMGARW